MSLFKKPSDSLAQVSQGEHFSQGAVVSSVPLFLKSREFLKVLAILTMFIDHLSLTLFPDFALGRSVGRLCFPIYAYLIGTGFDITRNKSWYILRLLFLAIISQYGYFLIFGSGLNVIFTFVFSLLILYTWEKKKRFRTVLLLALALIIPFEFGIYGILSVFVLRFFDHNFKSVVFIFIILTVIYSIYLDEIVQVLAVFALLVINFKFDSYRFVVPKYFWRFFYPLHFFVLVSLRTLFNYF